MILHTLAEIAQYMRVSKSAIYAWHTRPKDRNLAFPLIAQHSGHGSNGIKYVTDTALISEWLNRKARLCAQIEKPRAINRWRLRSSPQSAARIPTPHEQPKRQRRATAKLGPSKHVFNVVDNPITELSPFDTISQVPDK